jgi:hypothetical protein
MTRRAEQAAVHLPVTVCGIQPLLASAEWTGMPAGKLPSACRFPANSIFGRVDKRLREMANIMREHNRPDVGN